MSKRNGADAGYEMVLDFDIDGPDFSEVETLAFCLGFEFGKLYATLRTDPGASIDEWVHTSNVERIRGLCRRMGRECSVVHVDDGWSYLEVEAPPK